MARHLECKQVVPVRLQRPGQQGAPGAPRKASAAGQPCLGEHACPALFFRTLSSASGAYYCPNRAVTYSGQPHTTPLTHPYRIQDRHVNQSSTERRSVLLGHRNVGLRPIAFAAVLAAVMLTACSPSFAPLYTDYEYDAETATTDSTIARLERAVAAAGWKVDVPPAPNVVATNERTFNRWGLYDIRINLELIPINDRYVRLMIHPYRVYFTGNRSKMPFLKRSIRRAVVPDLTEALEKENLVPIGSAVERDKVARR